MAHWISNLVESLPSEVKRRYVIHESRTDEGAVTEPDRLTLAATLWFPRGEVPLTRFADDLITIDRSFRQAWRAAEDGVPLVDVVRGRVRPKRIDEYGLRLVEAGEGSVRIQGEKLVRAGIVVGILAGLGQISDTLGGRPYTGRVIPEIVDHGEHIVHQLEYASRIAFTVSDPHGNSVEFATPTPAIESRDEDSELDNPS